MLGGRRSAVGYRTEQQNAEAGQHVLLHQAVVRQQLIVVLLFHRILHPVRGANTLDEMDELVSIDSNTRHAAIHCFPRPARSFVREPQHIITQYRHTGVADPQEVTSIASGSHVRRSIHRQFDELTAVGRRPHTGQGLDVDRELADALAHPLQQLWLNRLSRGRQCLAVFDADQ